MISSMDKLNKQELDMLRNISIRRLLGVKEDGRKLSIKCVFPNHNDGTPSLLIDIQNGYYCFGCKKCGFGAIDFCEDLGYSFKETIQELSKHLHDN
jgi:DNA primase